MPDILICQMLVDAVVAFALLELAVLVAWHALTRRGLAAAELVANLSAGLCLLGALRGVLAGSSWPVCALWLAAAGVAHATDLVRRLRPGRGPGARRTFLGRCAIPFPPLISKRFCMTSRRRFISMLPLPLLGAASLARAQAGPLDPKDPQATALGYSPDATKVDKAKFPKYAAPQACGNCALYQGAPGSSSGPCPIYAGKVVQAKGWCSAYAKKA